MKDKFRQGLLNSSLSYAFATPVGNMMLESARQENEAEALRLKEQEDEAKKEQERTALLESAERIIEERRIELEEREAAAALALKNGEPEIMFANALMEAAATNDRGTAAASVLQWKSDGDASSESFEEYAFALAGISDDETDLTDDEVDNFNTQLDLMAQAAIALGASADDVATMIDEDDSDAAQAVMDAISTPDDEDAAVASFAVSGGDNGAMMESAMMEAAIKVVRKGQIVLKRKVPHKVRLSSLQKAALKKARMKAHTAMANMSRAKSMKVRRKRGL